MLRIALTIQFLSGMWLILTAFLDLGFWPIAIGVAFFVGPNPVISSNAMASALERCPQMAGTANSLISSVRFAVGAIMGSLSCVNENGYCRTNALYYGGMYCDFRVGVLLSN
ncbi:Bicyclomycin resistance protein [Haemophilus influenzae]|nr:Bicyclomycin resistance protein [Haemophilus influenzae]PRJ95768.1 Bicyclomycin resistance protein [Haemophilus influenzae]PRK61805.1 Bicyclomycin resistance protein [Haemophilus influenzae]PRM08881.1 Bicyclomycin resistance protein [Haemophilus influenzae]